MIKINYRQDHSARTTFRCRGKYSTIGIDLGAGLVKLLQLKQARGRVHIFQKCLFYTPEGALSNGKIADSSSLIELLHRSKQKFKWHGNRAALCLDSRSCYMRTVIMPPMKTGELDRAMRWEVNKHFPLPAADAVIGYKCTAAATYNGKPARVYLLAAAPKETADQYTALAVKAGFNPVSLETAPPVMLRSSLHNPRAAVTKNSAHRLIVDLGHESTGLLLVNNHGYRYHRHLNIGAASFCRAVRCAETAGRTAALQRTFSAGSLAEKGLLDVAGKLARGISESLEYWAGQNAPAEIGLDAVEAGGGGIFIPGLAAFLQDQLGLKLVLYNPFGLFTAAAGPNNSAAEQRGALFPIAHGLALRGWLK